MYDETKGQAMHEAIIIFWQCVQKYANSQLSNWELCDIIETPSPFTKEQLQATKLIFELINDLITKVHIVELYWLQILCLIFSFIVE